MQVAFIDPILAASDVVVKLNQAHRSSDYSGYADTLLIDEGLPLGIRRFRVWPPVIGFSEVKNVFHSHGVRLGCLKFTGTHSGRE